MQLVKEQKKFIEDIVKNNPKYIGNEDLSDDFVNETYERSHIILGGVSDYNKIKSYLLKVANTAILNVLKNNSRIKRTTEGYIKNTEISIDTDLKFKTVNFDVIDINSSFEKKFTDVNLLENIIKIVKKLDEKNPLDEYFKIFALRYHKGLRQTQISEILNISQSEVSKRLSEIVEYVKTEIDV